MDIYTLGRMFRDYQYIPNQNSSQAKNMIIYAGGQHTHRYIDFLTNSKLLYFIEPIKNVQL